MSKMLDLVFNIDVFMSNGFSNKLSGTVQRITELSEKTKALNTVSGKIDSYRKQTQSLQTLQDKLKTAKTREQQLFDQVTFGTKANSKLYDEYRKAARQSEELTRNYGEQKQKLDELGQSLQNSGVNLNNLSLEQERYRSSIDKTAEQLARLQQAQAKVDKYNPKEIWQNFKGDIMKSAATLKVFEKPIKINMDFQQAMANVRAVMNPTKEEFEKLSEQAMELGSKTQFTSIQAANAQENLARAGFNSQQILDSMPHILTMAAADGMDIAQASEIMSKTLSQFEMDSSEAKRVADVLAMTSASSNTNIAKIGEGMIKLAPQAKLLGISLEQAAAFLGSIANNYQDGSEGGTAIARIAMRLAGRQDIRGSGKKGDVLNGLNVVIQRDGKLRKIDQILTDLNSQMDKRGMKEKQRAQVFEELFGKQYSSAAGALTSQAVTGKYQGLENKNIYERNDKAQSMANIRNDTLKGDLTALSSAWEGFMIKVGKPLETWSRNIVQGLTKALTGINNFIQNHQTLMDVVIKIGGAYAGWKIGSSVLRFFGNVIEYGKSLWELRDALKAVNAAQGLTGAAGGIKGLLSLANPWIVAAVAISGVIALLWNWEEVTQYISEVWRDLVDWWNNITLADIFSPLYDFAVMACERLKKPFLDIYNWICDLFSSLNPFAWADKAAANYQASPELKAAQAKAGLNGTGTGRGTNHRARALGGMITRPEIALIGEAGPEAIIPLSAGKKTRGLQVLSMAAESLGVNILPSQNQTLSTHVTNSQLNTLNRVTGYTDNQNVNSYTGINNILSEGVLNPPMRENENSGVYNTRNMNPVINITVNASGSDNANESGLRSIADNIYDKVKEALNEIMNNEARLSYA